VAALESERAERSGATRSAELEALRNEKEQAVAALEAMRREMVVLRRQKETAIAAENRVVAELEAERSRAAVADVTLVQQQLQEERRQSSLLQALSAVVTFSEFHVVRTLGVGGFGLVFECTPTNPALAELAPSLAVKVMHNYGKPSTLVTKDYK
jgi:hypothetical protein